MNFRQIQLLNSLEKRVKELEAEIDSLRDFTNAAFISTENRIQQLENPPKRPRGRPRKVHAI